MTELQFSHSVMAWPSPIFLLQHPQTSLGPCSQIKALFQLRLRQKRQKVSKKRQETFKSV